MLESSLAVTGRTTVIVVTYNSETTIAACLRSVLASGDDLEILVVDNASSDETLARIEALEEAGRVRVIQNEENEGFSQAVNRGLEAGQGDAFLLLNPDTLVPPGFVRRLRWHLKSPGEGRVAAVGPLSDYVAGSQQVAAHVDADALAGKGHLEIDRVVQDRYSQQSLETKLLIGMCLLLPRSTIEAIGPLDPALFLGNDDLDYSWRVRLAGMRLLVAGDVFVHHQGQVSFGTLAEGVAGKLVQHSTDVLARKLLGYYGWGSVPRAEQLWGIGWFEPSFDIWRPVETHLRAEVDWSDGGALRQLVAEHAERYSRDDAVVLTLEVPSADELGRAAQRLDAAIRVAVPEPLYAPEIRLSPPGEPTPDAHPAPSERYDTAPELDDPSSAQSKQFSAVASGSTVLDIGCSTGNMALALAQRKGCRVVGLEFDLASVEVARSRGVMVVHGSADEPQDLAQARSLAEVDGFDALLFGDVLEHVPDPDATLRKCVEVLAPGGSVVASIPNVAHGSIRLDLMMGRFEYRDTGLLDRTHLQLFTADRIRQLMAGAGLQLEGLMEVHVAVQGAEGRAMPGTVPQVLVDFLATDPTATVYQYVAHARKPI